MKPDVLKVTAVPGLLVAMPRQRADGTARYVGRHIDHAAVDANGTADECYPIVVTEIKLADGVDRYAEVARQVRAGDLLASDEITANYCGVRAALPRKAKA